MLHLPSLYYVELQNTNEEVGLRKGLPSPLDGNDYRTERKRKFWLDLKKCTKSAEHTPNDRKNSFRKSQKAPKVCYSGTNSLDIL